MEINNKEIDGGKGFDWGRTSEDYAKYRDIYPEVFYTRLIEKGLCVKGQRVLDIGTGTGVLPRNLYKYGAEFIGVDISENQIEQARYLSEKAGLDISYIVSAAETVDFPDNYFDTITACQCYIYFNKDTLFQKMHSILKPSGYFCILYFVYLPNESEIVFNSEKLILKYNPSWSASGATRWIYDLPEEAKGLFEVEEASLYDISVPFTRESWHGRMKTCRGIGASSLLPEEISSWERDHIEYLESIPESFEIPHFVTMLNLRKI